MKIATTIIIIIAVFLSCTESDSHTKFDNTLDSIYKANSVDDAVLNRFPKQVEAIVKRYLREDKISVYHAKKLHSDIYYKFKQDSVELCYQRVEIARKLVYGQGYGQNAPTWLLERQRYLSEYGLSLAKLNLNTYGDFDDSNFDDSIYNEIKIFRDSTFEIHEKRRKELEKQEKNDFLKNKN